MKSKQLANVLIKMLGLSVCISGIPGCVRGIVMALSSFGLTKTDAAEMALGYAMGAGVQVLFGIILIVASRKISGWMFTKDDE
ncbi:MAG: hypothetical protein ABSG80_11420 [Verrucomicrobiota bacterium]|jgi:hypothetical protein